MQRRGFIATAIAAVLSPLLPLKGKAGEPEEEEVTYRAFREPGHHPMSFNDLASGMDVSFEPELRTSIGARWWTVQNVNVRDDGTSVFNFQPCPVLTGETDG